MPGAQEKSTWGGREVPRAGREPTSSGLCLLGPVFFLAQPHKKESPASVPALQRSGEIGRAQGCLKADTAAGFGRCGQQWWSSGRLPAALAVDPYSIFLGCCPILTYSQTLSKGFTVALTAKTQFVNVVFSPQNQGVFLNQLNRVEVHLPTVKSC